LSSLLLLLFASKSYALSVTVYVWNQSGQTLHVYEEKRLYENVAPAKWDVDVWSGTMRGFSAVNAEAAEIDDRLYITDDCCQFYGGAGQNEPMGNSIDPTAYAQLPGAPGPTDVTWTVTLKRK
jgi:hypothetical protein